VVLTGDLHVQLVADVAGADGTVVATELVAPSISSRASEQLAPVVDLLPSVARDVVFADDDRRGWLRCDVSADGWTATYREVIDATDPASEVVDGARFAITRGQPGARPA
jgi:alkaline phosphatase D